MVHGNSAYAQSSGRLLATAGLTQIEGDGGGGLAPWTLITGDGTREAVGVNAHYTLAYLPGSTLHFTGASVGLFSRVELSYDHQWLDTRDSGAKLGLSGGYHFQMDVVGAKVPLFGNAVYDQDSWLPQVAFGAQFTTNNQHATLRAIGARSPTAWTYTSRRPSCSWRKACWSTPPCRPPRRTSSGCWALAATAAAIRPSSKGSAALLLSRNFAVGAELRTRPGNLRFAREDVAWDVFKAWLPPPRSSRSAASRSSKTRPDFISRCKESSDPCASLWPLSCRSSACAR